MLFGQAVDILLALVTIVLGDNLALLFVFELLVGVTSDITNTDFCLLPQLFHMLGKLTPSLGTQRRDT